MNGHTHIFESTNALYQALEKQWYETSQAAIADHGAFHVALAGGGTPRRFYEGLAQQSVSNEACWAATHVYFGDERCVPPDHSDSNFCMANEALLSKVPLPSEHAHAMFSENISAKENAARYETLLIDTLPLDAKGKPVFDLILLGMGEDGHTASLFPDTEILQESEKRVAAQFVPKLDAWRVSLTFPTINAANHVTILLVGESKAEVLRDIASIEENTDARYPIQQVNPAGNLDWYLDAAVAHLLKGPQ